MERRNISTRVAAEGERRALGRVDSIVIAVEVLSRDPMAMIFGLGAGNVSKSPIKGFSGEYAHYYGPYGVGMTQLTSFMWEIGLFGVAIYLLLYLFVFRDAYFLARNAEGAAGVLGHAWATVMIIMTFALAYKDIFLHE